VDGPAIAARLKAPNAIAVDRQGVIYVADTRTIRKIGLDGSITTLAGDPYAKDPYPTSGGGPYYVDGRGPRAVFMHPAGLAVDRKDNVYVADSYDGPLEGQSDLLGIVRRINRRGVVTTVVANLQYLPSVAINSVGQLFVAEPYSPTAIRKIGVNGSVSTVITPRNFSYLSTDLNLPAGIAIGRCTYRPAASR
jgi:sugar lactone lactonase YvrE